MFERSGEKGLILFENFFITRGGKMDFNFRMEIVDREYFFIDEGEYDACDIDRFEKVGKIEGEGKAPIMGFMEEADGGMEVCVIDFAECGGIEKSIEV